MEPRYDASLRLEPAAGPKTAPYELPPDGPAVLGRSRESTIVLSDPRVSRRHARLVPRRGRWFAGDLGTKRGTFVNGVRLDGAAPAELASGDLLRVGPYSFRVALGPPVQGEVLSEAYLAPTTQVEIASSPPSGALAADRLALLMEGVAGLPASKDEATLARVVVDLSLDGTGGRRAAVLRHASDGRDAVFLACRDLSRDGSATTFAVSRTVLSKAADGEPVQLLRPTSASSWGESTRTMGVHSAVCVPVLLDGAVYAYLYLDARDGEPAFLPDAVGFAQAVARMAGPCIGTLKHAELAERQRSLERDIDAARQAQVHLLPSESGRVGHLRYHSRTLPGTVVSGDLYDVFELGEGRVAVCIADVVGHGIAAGILMAAVLSHLRASLARYGEPAQVVRDTNVYLVERTSPGTFVSLWLGVFDREQSMVRFVDAGHGHWLARRGGQPFATGPRSGHAALGIRADWDYTAQPLELGPGDRLMLYSDGAVEPRNTEGEEFGSGRLIDCLAGSEDCESDVAAGLRGLDAFLAGEPRDDDTTLLSVEVAKD